MRYSLVLHQHEPPEVLDAKLIGSLPIQVQIWEFANRVRTDMPLGAPIRMLYIVEPDITNLQEMMDLDAGGRTNT